jgi:hypothetical protein
VLDALRHQTVSAPRPNEFTRGTGPSLWTLQPGKLVRTYDSQGACRVLMRTVDCTHPLVLASISGAGLRCPRM